jgi:hypothetical protein
MRRWLKRLLQKVPAHLVSLRYVDRFTKRETMSHEELNWRVKRATGRL